ncbi:MULTISPECIES: phasin family protein [Sphingomonas]|uniref:Phasin family protein n=1 Tax=Sphingomonas kyeonggiensis TaxID=1268553 RepID=A0A7W7JZJ9_9SPHN|nr:MULTISPECIES: phasin family protein [Sphingomonas]MBB4838297.1 phasin family protein [Sphingomonas kyeonggiensis]WHU01253.1 TIGR01841 family phasin [Sphingomonas sp. NIBR02145]
MATKGPKTGKPAAPKPAARAKAAPAKVAAPKAETPVQEKVAKPIVETIVKAPVAEPAPVLADATQEVTETVEAVVEPIVEAVTETATTAVEIVEETVAAPAVKEKVMTTIENATGKAQALFAEWNDRTKAAVEKSTKLVEEANDFAKGNVEALVESGRIAAKGFEGLGQDAAEYSRKSFESATAALKSFSSAKTPADFFKLQSDYFRGAFDSYVAEASKNTEALIKLASDAAQPLSNRVAVAAEKVKTAA